MENVRVSYKIYTNSPPGHFIIFRLTEGDGWLQDDAWNSKHKVWKHDYDAAGAFCGFTDHVDDISEEEVIKILAKFGEILQPYVYKKERVEQTVA